MRWTALLLVLILGACDSAISDRPMFMQADTVGAPRFENGVWSPVEQDDCEVDQRKRVSKWPKCAFWAFHKDGQWYLRDGQKGIKTRPVGDFLLIVGGELAIAQIEQRPVEPQENATFLFWALDFDGESATALRAFRHWPVLCGLREDVPVELMTTDGSPGEGAIMEQLVRFPGFNEQCRPDSVASLRAAALASRPTAIQDASELRWVRAELN